MSSSTSQDRSEIVFFDLETTLQPEMVQTRHLLEFGAILVCPLTLVELDHYTTLVRPSDLSAVPVDSVRSNGITRDMVASAPPFREVADKVYDILNGRVWAGHNIVHFDWVLIREAFDEIGLPAPVPKETIDTLILLRQRFGTRAGDMKMATLATYFGLGEQPHRSLDDVRMNLEVVKYCSTVLFLEGFSGYDEFLDHDKVSIRFVSASLCPSFFGERVQLMYRNAPLQLCSANLRVRHGVNDKYPDSAGRPRRTIVVDTSSSLCQVLDVCDNLAENTYVDSGGSSKWRHVVNDFPNSPFIRLNIPYSKANMASENNSVYTTEMHLVDSAGTSQRLVFNTFDANQLDSLFQPGALIDTFFSLEAYDFRQQWAGISLVAKKLIIYSE